jgi:hypothetical protein
MQQQQQHYAAAAAPPSPAIELMSLKRSPEKFLVQFVPAEKRGVTKVTRQGS